MERHNATGRSCLLHINEPIVSELVALLKTNPYHSTQGPIFEIARYSRPCEKLEALIAFLKESAASVL